MGLRILRKHARWPLETRRHGSKMYFAQKGLFAPNARCSTYLSLATILSAERKQIGNQRRKIMASIKVYTDGRESLPRRRRRRRRGLGKRAGSQYSLIMCKFAPPRRLRVDWVCRLRGSVRFFTCCVLRLFYAIQTDKPIQSDGTLRP